MTARLRQSAILIAVPGAEPLVGALRALHDPSASAGVPAHITLLYPFAPPDAIDEEIVEAIRAVATESPQFAFALREIAWFDEGQLYLAPSPTDPFLELISRLAERFPAWPPYGGIHDVIVPHLTVATPGAPEMERSLLAGLPVNATASEIALMQEGDDGRWSTRERFPLGVGG